MNKIHFYRPNSILGHIITWITRSQYSHVTVEVDGQLYDSSESRATFGKSKIDNSKRIPKTYNLPDASLDYWLELMEGKEYDWKGVIGWLFHADDRHKFYCFETGLSALKYLNLTRIVTKQVSARTLVYILENRADG